MLGAMSGGLVPVRWRVAVWNGVTWMIVTSSSAPGNECTSAPLSMILGDSPHVMSWRSRRPSISCGVPLHATEGVPIHEALSTVEVARLGISYAACDDAGTW